ncbi:tetratricopeptide repeat protein [Heyndrickxia sp. NPDC080065]|uniref:tetratricopeptide repeat protein n=1 Tax=Heyndrickxia sp. NPDC080065 TaxID=3390568 RepID=UPI003D0101DE
MKKKDKGSKDQNIVLFPGLKDRLLEFGLKHLDNHQYDEAVNLLRQAYEIDPENEEIGMGFLLALYESSNYEEAKDVCKELLHKGIGSYFEIIDVYLMILIQLSNHNEVVHTIKALLDENEVPMEKVDHYEKLLQFSQNRVITDKQPIDTHLNKKMEPLFLNGDMKESIFKIAGLANQNIFPHLTELTNYLENESAHPFLQTMVLNLLREHGIDKNIVVKKFHYEETLIPVNLNAVFETPFYLVLIDYMKEKIENENPTLFNQIKEMADRHLFLLYPYELIPNKKNLWTAAYHSFGHELYGESMDLNRKAKDYEVDVSSLVNAIGFIKKLEEISLPIV